MGSSAMAEDPAQSAPAAAPAAAVAPAAAPAEDPNKMVCRSLEAPTGSRLGTRRECKTQKEWDDARLQSQRDVSHLETSGQMGLKNN
jgi:hypothetical protein